MAAKAQIRPKNKFQQEFIEKFKTLCETRSSWQVWADVITTIACSIANSVDHDSESHDKREQEYEECIKRLGGMQIPSELFGIIIMALDDNPEQDFLGELFMMLDLGSHWKGQFFTPYCICKTMSMITACGVGDEVADRGWTAVQDCACGAGATLIAAANTFKDNEINYQDHVLFVAQDIDRITAMMCYIQLSLLGCPGYVVVANSLSNPICGNVLMPTQKENQEFWFTPMYVSDVWTYRRLFNTLDMMLRK